MAATETRAAQEHTNKSRFVKDDAGRVSKFSGCPSSFSSRLDSNGTPSGAASGLDQATPLRVPDNQNLVTTHDSQWWLHSWHHIENQKYSMLAQLNVPQFELEVSDAEFFFESPKISKEYYINENSLCSKDGVSGDSGNACTECVKSDQDVRKEESGPLLDSNAQKPPNKDMGESWYLVDNLMALEHNCLISEQPKTHYSDFDSRLVQAEKTEPWWHITDKDELAFLVAQKSLEHIENCDLPRPKTKDISKGQLHSPASFGRHETLHSSLDWTIQTGFLDLSNKDELASMVAQKSLEHIENCDLPRPKTKDISKGQLHSPASFGRQETLPSSLDWTIQTGFSDLSNHHWERTSSVSLDEKQCMLGNVRNLLPNSDSLLSSNDFSSPKMDHGVTQTFPGKDPSTTQLLEALRYSQRRAREAEKAAEKAYNEKEHIITLFFRQASQLFAYKQWLQLLQLENFSLQLAYKKQPISSLLPDGLLVFPYKGMQLKKAQDKVVKQKKSSSKSTTAFWVGLSLAGAGLLLGWTMGWLLPST
ncbi:hypothetical protein PTKIN_Ptkin05aG0094400 [Pterospermum kingtungense]